jgi:DnaD/phage-associated family protein
VLSLSYEINPTAYRKVFVLPSQVVEDHIKLAGALQLKVLLWLFYHQGVLEDIQTLANDLGANPSDVQDALQYWVVNQIITTEKAPKEETVNEPSAVTVSPIVPIVPKAQKPSRSEVAKRGEESEEVSWLLREAQSKLNHTISFAEASTLVWLMDTYGLSPAVILMVIEYAVSVDKCNIRFIETTALNWIKNDITTVEQAENHLTELEQARTEWNLICRVFGLDKRKPSKQEEIYVSRWIREWKFSPDMLKAAYDHCVNNTGKVKFPYINKVLDDWHKAGFKKPADTQGQPQNTNNGKKGLQRASDKKSTSYNMEDLESLI